MMATFWPKVEAVRTGTISWRGVLRPLILAPCWPVLTVPRKQPVCTCAQFSLYAVRFVDNELEKVCVCVYAWYRSRRRSEAAFARSV